MIVIKYVSNGTLILSMSLTIVISVLTFNVFYFSTYYGFVQVNYLNSLLLVPFIVLIFSFGVILGKSKRPESLAEESENKLTAREKEIIQLIVKGKKNIEIANQLFVALSTIKSHINNIYKKEKVKSRKEIIKKFSHFPD